MPRATLDFRWRRSLTSGKDRRRIALISGPISRVTSGGYFAAKHRSVQPIWERLRAKINIVGYGYTKCLESSMTLKHIYFRDGIKIIVELARFLAREKFDVIVTGGMPYLESVVALVFAKLLKKPLIVRETHWYWPNTIPSKLVYPINRFILSHATLIITPGIKAKKYCNLIGIPDEKVKIVPYYTSVLEIDSRNAALANSLKGKFGNKFVILYFGRLIKKKGLGYLIKAFARLRKEFEDIVLVIAGDGPEKRNLEKMRKDLKLNDVYFTGAIDEETKPAYFLLADVYVYPCITLELPEEWPLGVVEAMSVGKPVVVTTAVGSAPDVVRHGVNGYIVPEKDSDALYSTIKKMLENRELRRNMGLRSKKIIEKAFTYDHAVKSLEEAIYASLK